MMMTCVFATENALANYLPVKKVRTTFRISEYHGTIGKNRVTFSVGITGMGVVDGYFISMIMLASGLNCIHREGVAGMRYLKNMLMADALEHSRLYGEQIR